VQTFTLVYNGFYFFIKTANRQLRGIWV